MTYMPDFKRMLSRVFTPKPPGSIHMQAFQPLPERGYLVGGAVRDTLLGGTPADLDWLVPDPESAAQDAAKQLNGNAFLWDEQRNYWRVISNKHVRDYAPLGDSLELNLLQRDFAMNAVAADTAGTLFDPAGGVPDIMRKRVRMIAVENLLADTLRPLRGVRLSVQLGFTLDAQTRVAITDITAQQRAHSAPLPAWERVAEELNALLSCADAAQGIFVMHELGMTALYLPELIPMDGVEQRGFHHLNVFEHSLEALRQLIAGFPDADLSLRWATLLHDVGKPATRTLLDDNHYHFYGHDKQGAVLTEQLLTRLRQPTERIRKARDLVRYHMLPLPKNDKEARRFAHKRARLLPDLLQLMIADREAARGPLSSERSRNAYRVALSRILAIQQEPKPKTPLINGNDLMQHFNLPPGPTIGTALEFIAEAEAVGDVRSKEEAFEALATFLEKQGAL